MKLDELLFCLNRCREKYGNINVCVYNDVLDMVSETIVPEFHDNDIYVNSCENEILEGQYLMLR